MGILDSLRQKWDAEFDKLTRLFSKGLAAAALHPKTTLLVLAGTHAFAFFFGEI